MPRARDPFAIPSLFFILGLLVLLPCEAGRADPLALFVVVAVICFVVGIVTCIPGSGTPRAQGSGTRTTHERGRTQMEHVALHAMARKRARMVACIGAFEKRGQLAGTAELAQALPWERGEVEDQLRVVVALGWAREQAGAWWLTAEGAERVDDWPVERR